MCFKHFAVNAGDDALWARLSSEIQAARQVLEGRLEAQGVAYEAQPQWLKGFREAARRAASFWQRGGDGEELAAELRACEEEAERGGAGSGQWRRLRELWEKLAQAG